MTVKVLRAFQPGDVLFIEAPGQLSPEARARIREEINENVPDGLRVVVLEGGLRIVAREEVQEVVSK